MFNGLEHMIPPLMEFNGMYMAEVIDDADPNVADSGRVKVRAFPMMTGLDEAVLPWAVPAMPLFAGAAADQGSYVVPAKNSKVWVFFAAGDVRSPVYFANAPGMTDGPSGREPQKMVFASRTGHTVTVSDNPDDTMVKVVTAAGHSVTLDDKNNKVEIVHKDGEKIVLTDSAVEIGKGTLKKLLNETAVDVFNNHIHDAGTLLLDSTAAPCTGVTAAPTTTLGSSNLTTDTKAS